MVVGTTMYMEILRRVVEDAVTNNAIETGRTSKEVLAVVKQHIDRTASQHRRDNPSIDYLDPLCRIGYLYRHLPANATLCERALRKASVLPQIGDNGEGSTLNVCALGGGPGTELLALAKHLVLCPQLMPAEISFTLVDHVSQWAETWQQLAELVESYLAQSIEETGFEPPRIKPNFIALDVLSHSTYQNYTRDFRRADVIVFNYLFSENKERLNEAQATLERLVSLAPATCAFVVVDRLEYVTPFKDQVVGLFEAVFGKHIEVYFDNRSIDTDEDKSTLGQELLDTLGFPRLKFYTFNREPTAFWFVAQKCEEAE